MDFYYESLRKNILKSNERTLSLYQDKVLSYNQIIENMGTMYDKFNINNLITCFVMFSYMMWNGYLSIDKKFEYSIKNNSTYSGYYGINIIEGKGCCLNASEMFCKLLKQLGLEAYLITAYMSDDIQINNRIKIKRTFSIDTDNDRKRENLISRGMNKFSLGNHAIVLVRCYDGYYLCDPINLCIYFLEKGLNARVVDESNVISLRAISLYVLEGIELSKISEIVNYNNSKNKIKNIGDYYDKGLLFCKENIDTFNNFYYNNIEIQDKIRKRVK